MCTCTMSTVDAKAEVSFKLELSQFLGILSLNDIKDGCFCSSVLSCCLCSIASNFYQQICLGSFLFLTLKRKVQSGGLNTNGGIKLIEHQSDK